MSRLLHAHPNTTIVACSRAGAEEVNSCAVEALFEKRRRRPLIEALQGDLETNPRNYCEHNLKPDEELEPLNFAVYKEMDVFLTKNVRKDIDFVNGMLAKVVSYNLRTQSLRVRTRTGHLIEVWRWSDPEHSGLAYYPVRPGYCSTVMKMQGAELDRITVYLDAPKVPGAAYTALGRVRRTENFLIGGKIADVHFTPAN